LEAKEVLDDAYEDAFMSVEAVARVVDEESIVWVDMSWVSKTSCGLLLLLLVLVSCEAGKRWSLGKELG
jgi:hypothetical protein